MEISEEKKVKLNKIKNIINLILAMFITLSPIVVIFMNVFSSEFVYLNTPFKLFGYAYLVFLPYVIFCGFLEKGFWDRVLEKLKKLPVILTLVLYGWIILSCMVTSTFNIFLTYFIIYICIFVCVVTLEEKYEGLLVNTLIIVMAECCLLGILDPTGRFMPGFNSDLYALSLQFFNPNYAGYLMALVSILNTWIMCTTKNKKQLTVSIVAFILLNIYLFMNASFAPITFLFGALFLMIVFVWIKEKKCPWKLIVSFLSIIPMAFIVDLVPALSKYRTCSYNYFLEVVAVLDNYLGTDMLSWFNIETIAGADGWDRGSRQDAAWAEVLGNAKTFFFGNGSGGNFEFLPHNTFLCLWLNYGIIATLLYYTINIYLIVRFFQLKNNIHLVGYMGSVVGYLMMMFTGDLIEYSFCFHMIVFAITFRKVEQAHALQEKEEREQHIQEYIAEHGSLEKKTRKTTTKKSSTSSTTKKKTTTNPTTKKTTTTRKPKNKQEENIKTKNIDTETV